MMRFTSIGFVTAGLVAILSSCNAGAPDTTSNPTVMPTNGAQVAEAPAIDQRSTPEPATPETPTDSASGTATSSPPSASPPSATEPATPAPLELIPSRYCYRLDDGIRTTHLRLRLDKNNQFKGDARSTIQNETAAYYTSYAQRFTGVLTNFEAAVEMTTWIEYDVQTGQETWNIHREQLKTEDATLDQVDCQLVDPVFQGDSGLEAGDLLDGATAIHRQEVAFAAGESSATVSNAVVRGERDVYLLGASGGQDMSLSITSLEENAVFDVISPSGYILVQEAMNETLLLPHTGDYQVIVGGTRGNASYDLTIGIQ